MKQSREYRLYLALWRKALRILPEPLEIKCPNHGLAIAMRQGMYRAIRPYREGTLLDSELAEAADRLVVSLLPDSCLITFRERQALTTLEKLMTDLGIEESDLLDSNEKSIQTDLERLLEETSKPRTTPFYTRED